MRTTIIAASMLLALLLLPVVPVGAQTTLPQCTNPPTVGVFCFTAATIVSGFGREPRPPRPPLIPGTTVFVEAVDVQGLDKNDHTFSLNGGIVTIIKHAAIGLGSPHTTNCVITAREPDCSQATLACADGTFHVVQNHDTTTGFPGAFDGVTLASGQILIIDPVACPAPVD